MKKYLIPILFLTSFLMSSAQTGRVYLFSYFTGNGEDGLHLAYSLDGLKFTALNNGKSFLIPVAGVSKLMRDPCIIRTPDGTFHMVWTAGWTERGIGYSSSRDLVNWTEQKYIMVMEKEPTARNCWAPEISFDKKNKQFLIIWSSTIPGRFPDTEKAGDTDYNHRIYCVTTKDFVTFSDTRLFYDKGFNVIDATINSNGSKFIMFVKDETRNPPQKNIRITSSNSLYGPFSNPSEPISGNYWAEGPSSIKINSTWYVYFDKYMEKKMGAVISKDLKSWEDISEKISFPDGVRHGTILQADRKILQNLLHDGQIR
jgi:beta-xylosidase